MGYEFVDTDTTHNYIDKKLVDRHRLQYEVPFGFGVKVVDGAILGCTRRIPRLSIQMGDYTLTDNFYVLPLEDYDVVWACSGYRALNDTLLTTVVFSYSSFLDGRRLS